ncbi:MAG: ABC transporter ATP-binding protein [Candidatus Tectomicrobia bacterium]|nr:ABC transporter ATP-binding protein [Candidatus Tectomicrobia bacterium]
MVTVKDLYVSYQIGKKKLEVLRGISFEVEKNSSLAIIGPSGCGKSTLLYAISGLKKPEGGAALIDGVTVDKPREKTALILQHYGLLPWKTVYENSVLGLKIRGIRSSERRRHVETILDDLEILAYASHYPKQLSGGQKQRVAIARALAITPDLLLMDEPFSSLDALTRENLQNLILEIWNKRRLTVILVTHSIEEAVFLGKRVIVMSHTGQIVETLHNPSIGSLDFRNHQEFFANCRYLREVLKALGNCS